MKISIAGDRNGKPWPRKGGEVDLPDAEAADMIRNGYAVAVESDPEPAVETAKAEPQDVETRPAPKTPKRRGGLTRASMTGKE